MKQINFTPDEFPILIEALHPETRAVIWSTKIDMPKDGELAHVRISGLRKIFGHYVTIRITHGNGRIYEKDYETDQQ